MAINMRVRQAAEYCGLSKSYLDKARIYGGGPTFMKFGQAVVYSQADLDVWMSTRRQPANDNVRAQKAAA